MPQPPANITRPARSALLESSPSCASAPLAVSIPEAARSLGIGKTSFYRLLNRGDIVPVRIGGRVVIPVRQLKMLLEKRALEAEHTVLPPQGGARQ